jgi:hypothetical protein
VGVQPRFGFGFGGGGNFSFDGPQFSLEGPPRRRFSPEGPQFSFDGPRRRFSPEGPRFSFEGPKFSFDGPTFSPEGPTFSPEGPLFLLAIFGAGGAGCFALTDFVTPDDIVQIARPALRHRIALAPEMQIEGRRVDQVLDALLLKVEAPRR